MPVSVATAMDPFRRERVVNGGSEPPPNRATMRVVTATAQPLPDTQDGLALPMVQARVLRCLYPKYPDDPPFEWPLYTRTVLGRRAGYTALSGSPTRALNGIRPGNRTSGEPHPGLIARGMVEIVTLDIMGTQEDSYRITHLGIRAMRQHLETHGELPPMKDSSLCVNRRFRNRLGQD